MPIKSQFTATVTSTALRLGSYIYFRWVPGPAIAGPALMTTFVVYLTSAILTYCADHEYVKITSTVMYTKVVEIESAEPASSEVTEDKSYADAPKNDKPPTSEKFLEEDVSMIEETAYTPKASRPIRTLLTGSPRKVNKKMSIVTILLNLLLVLGIADYTFTSHHFWPADDLSFVRVGYVSSSEARFLLREPDQSVMPISVEIRIKDPQPPFDSNQWQMAGGVRWTTEEKDFTASLNVPLPHAQQHVYEWVTSNNHTGEFRSAPKPGAVSRYDGGKFTFLSTSCIIPRFPYSPADHPLTIPGMRALAKVLPSLNAQFMLFLGDFIYIDVPYIFGKTKEHYRRKYRQVYASPEWAQVGQNMSWIHTLDDHEIANNWSANVTGEYLNAMDAFNAYHAATNPPAARAAGSHTPRAGSTYFEFTQGPISVFMLDTRSYRSDNLELEATYPNKTMLGAEQLADLIYWLNRPEPKGVSWKVIASSVPFTKNWPVDGVDTWGGFLAERRKVLEAMWDSFARGVGVVILSGDRHEFAVTKFPPPPGGKWPSTATPYEFSVSPLNQFSSPIPTYRQMDAEDEQVAYIHLGLSKFGAITIETYGDEGRSTLFYQMYLDGEKAWNITLTSPVKSEAERKKGKGLFWWRD